MKRQRISKQKMLEIDRASLATRIRHLREQKLWTQEVLANKAGLAVRTVQRVENGTFTCYFETAAQIAKAFGVKIEALL